MLKLTDLENRIVREQCQFCQFWNNDEGCQYPGTISHTPLTDCFSKETAAYFVNPHNNKRDCPLV